MAETIRKVQKQGKLLDSTPDTPGSTPVRPIQNKLQELDTNYKNLLEMSRLVYDLMFAYQTYFDFNFCLILSFKDFNELWFNVTFFMNFFS